MPIIEPNKTKETEKIKISINKNILAEVRKYCEWIKVNEEIFFEQAAEFVLKKDKDWTKYKKGK